MLGYHLSSNTLRNGQALPATGHWIQYHGPLVMHKRGFYAAEAPHVALVLGQGYLLHKVELDGDLQPDPIYKGAWVGRKRRILASIDATNLLRRFACDCAADVLDLWPAPEIVRRFLETGSGALRKQAEVAATDFAKTQGFDSPAWHAAEAAGCAAAVERGLKTAFYALAAMNAAGQACCLAGVSGPRDNPWLPYLLRFNNLVPEWLKRVVRPDLPVGVGSE